MNVLKRIKEINWDSRVTRAGFVQSKLICIEAETQKVKLTDNTSILNPTTLWINDLNIYDDDKTKEFSPVFDKAFEEDPDWPVKKADHLKRLGEQVKNLISDINGKNWENSSEKEKVASFKKYVELLMAIQQYYVIAVPLTNYCDKKLEDRPEILEEFAVPIYSLDLDTLSDDYSWLRTTYNIINEVSKEDVANIEHCSEKPNKSKLPEAIRILVNGLQTGIYLRNRMKELSQQLWYNIEPVAQSMAEDMGIERNEFFYLTSREVMNFYENASLPDKDEIKARSEYCLNGVLDNELILYTGEIARKVFDMFNKYPDSEEITGRTACKGFVKGKVRLVMNISEVENFEEGEILVTSMTTPDFVPIMHKAVAIVTDEGGLSCHAAIVAREMNKPCIIGTKNATKVLKDGDLVEVDADNGTVKKL